MTGPVIIHCPHHITFEGEIIMRPCSLLYGHDGQCKPDGAPWGNRNRTSPDGPAWADDPRLWILGLSHGWPVIAHLVTASEAGNSGHAVAHTTACGHRYTTQFTFGAYITSVTAGGLLPLADISVHCGMPDIWTCDEHGQVEGPRCEGCAEARRALWPPALRS